MLKCYVPNSARAAGREIRFALARGIEATATPSLIRAWCCVAYLFPGLHPDGFAEPDSGWSRVLARFAAEVWSRVEAAEISEAELYPSDAQWAGIFDRMLVHLPDETEQRISLAASFGQPSSELGGQALQ